MTIDEFKNMDLRVGKIINAGRMPNSEKLVQLQVGFGEETRQIIAGIGKTYEPESLVGKEIVVVYNLEPREFILRHDSGQVALRSEGMLLAARDENNEPVILIVDKEVPPGSKIS